MIDARLDLIDQVRALAAAEGIEPIPPAPEVRDELYVLGEALMFDKILSGNETIACASCHHPTIGTDDDRHLPLGEGGHGLGADRLEGHLIPRNSPPLFNLHAMDVMFWDGRVMRREDTGELITPAGDEITPEMEAVFEFGAASAQAMFPVTSFEEMRGEPGTNPIADAPDVTTVWRLLMERLGQYPMYVALFEAAYPGTRFEDMTFAHAANALAGFEIRTFESRGSRWQQFLEGDDDALTYEELVGARAFMTDGCTNCHTGSMFTDEDFHNTGLAQFGPGKGHGVELDDDFGRAAVTQNGLDSYAFRTPPLHNIALTAPYGHDGQYATLETFIEHYADPAESLRTYDPYEHVAEHEVELCDMVCQNMDLVLDGIDPDTKVDSEHFAEIEAFLGTLTDERMIEAHWAVPTEVPSGMPVED